MKIASNADLAVLGLSPDPNHSENCVHEEDTVAPSDIGIRREIHSSVNDRIIWKWQSHAGRFSEKTKDQHLSALREFEELIGRKSFDSLTRIDVAKVREVLKERLQPNAANRKSKSTVQHVASHIKDFLIWLLKQDGYKRLSQDLPEYLDLPKAVYAKAFLAKRREYPDLEEARRLLEAMPLGGALHHRNRAIFALAFLGALRADTLISLRLKHIDVGKRQIIQDAHESRTKNGKSLTIAWFPIPKVFEDVVISWVERMEKMGYKPDDALFPSSSSLETYCNKCTDPRVEVAPMASIYAVSEAFRTACKNHHSQFSPHAAKHTIAAERNRRPLTRDQQKAWSQNMGHENEKVTERHYGKMAEDRQLALMEGIHDNEGRVLLELSAEEKVALVDKVVEEILRGREH